LNSKKNILICPLDWGLGHATRCIPLINYLLLFNVHVVIAAGGRSGKLLKEEFPHLTHIYFPGFNVRYARYSPFFVIKMAIALPWMLWSIVKENRQLKKIIEKHAIDAIISDNRYGLWSKKIPCIFITHQLYVQLPIAVKWLQKPVDSLVKFLIKRFTECWVPDTEGFFNLSGNLSHKKQPDAKVFFIGPLSRFSHKTKEIHSGGNDIDVLAILSGPEPQRSIFEKIILKQVAGTSLRTVIVQGITGEKTIKNLLPHVTLLSFQTTTELEILIQRSQLIIARAGYSTLMDLAVFKKQAILVPTPGQTEQKYLARYHKERIFFYSVSQSKFSLTEAQHHLPEYHGIALSPDETLLLRQIASLIEKIS
jgi:uncharacterized protein (TIGR00661 family)